MIIAGGYNSEKNSLFEQRISNDKHVDLSQG